MRQIVGLQMMYSIWARISRDHTTSLLSVNFHRPSCFHEDASCTSSPWHTASCTLSVFLMPCRSHSGSSLPHLGSQNSIQISRDVLANAQASLSGLDCSPPLMSMLPRLLTEDRLPVLTSWTAFRLGSAVILYQPIFSDRWPEENSLGLEARSLLRGHKDLGHHRTLH